MNKVGYLDFNSKLEFGGGGGSFPSGLLEKRKVFSYKLN